MADAALLAGTLALCFVGFAWLALAMDAHWSQVFGMQQPCAAERVRLRVLGFSALGTSLALALAVNHASIAVLVWVMALAAAALAVALVLAWRPRVIGFLAPWCGTRLRDGDVCG